MITSLITFLPISLGLFCQAPKIINFLPTSTIVRVGEMAARDEGYNVNARGIYFNEMRKNGKEPILGYASIGLFEDSQLLLLCHKIMDLADRL